MLSKLNIDQGGVDIPMKKKTVHVSGKEVSFFNKIFDMVDCDSDDKVCGERGFLRVVDQRQGGSAVPQKIRP